MAIGYDIACSFSSTVKNSSLGPHAQHHGTQFVVPSFHGYAHNRACQLQWHPLHIHSLGIEDFEVCERVFKGSNALASVVHNDTHFHRKQAIDMYFHQHYEDKYELLCEYTSMIVCAICSPNSQPPSCVTTIHKHSASFMTCLLLLVPSWVAVSLKSQHTTSGSRKSGLTWHPRKRSLLLTLHRQNILLYSSK